MAHCGCFECGNQAVHRHHVVPESRGGTKTVPLCAKCHAKAHHMDQNMAAPTLIREKFKQLKADGFWLGAKEVYGYEKQGNKRVIIPSEQLIIAIILGMYALGATLNHICDTLNAAAVKRRGRNWHPESVRREILKGL